ncbi:MAG: exosortase C-terminal domain/associated protein EpsI [Actinomycetota bacterium]
MQKSDIRYTTLLIILLIFSAVIIFIQYPFQRSKTTVDISQLPLVIGKWKGEDIIFDKKIKEKLETDSILFREYKLGSNSVWLLIVYYQERQVSLSLVECYSGGFGSRIIKNDVQDIGFPVNRLILEEDKVNKILLYYFETSKIRTTSYAKINWQMISNKLKAKSNSGALVRFSSRIKSNSAKTSAILEDFVQETSPLISRYLFNK